MTAPRPARKSRDIETFLWRQRNLRNQRRFLALWNHREADADRPLRRLHVGPKGDVQWLLAQGEENVRYSDLGGQDRSEFIP